MAKKKQDIEIEIIYTEGADDRIAKALVDFYLRKEAEEPGFVARLGRKKLS